MTTSTAVSGYCRTSYADRIEIVQTPLAKRILQICEAKQTNLCLAADLTDPDKILNLVRKVGKEICVLKLHIDMIDFASIKELGIFIGTLQALSLELNFVIFEDRKFNDIGKTVQSQYTGGIYEIAKWAPLSNLMTVSGPDILKALRDGIKETAKKVPAATDNAFLLLAEMSSKDNKFPLFVKQVYEEAIAASDIALGFIAQRSFGDPRFLHFTPGVNSVQKGDNLGQQYNTPETVINKGADIIIIGTGICDPKDGKTPEQAAEEYRAAGWKAHCEGIGMAYPFPPAFAK